MQNSKQLNEKRKGSINHLQMTEADYALTDKLINRFRSAEFRSQHEESKLKRFTEIRKQQALNPFYSPRFSHPTEFLEYMDWLEESSE